MKVLVVQLCPTLWDPMDCSPPGSCVHGILQARIPEWVAISFSRGSSWPRDRTRVACLPGRFFTIWAPGKPFRNKGHSKPKALESSWNHPPGSPGENCLPWNWFLVPKRSGTTAIKYGTSSQRNTEVQTLISGAPGEGGKPTFHCLNTLVSF